MYSVIASDGHTYGPVDMSTLRTWCVEGRVTPETNLIDAVSGRTMRASDLQDLYDMFPPPPMAQPPYQQPGPSYQQPGPTYQPPGPNPGAFAPGQRPGGYPGQYYTQGQTPFSQAPYYGQQVGSKSKVAAALLAFFLGGLGVHRFYLGYNGTGVIMLVLGLLGWVLFCIPTVIVGIWALIDLVMILSGGLKDANGYDLC